MAIGDEDPAVAGLKEALAKARAQAQLRPVQDRIAHTEAFLDRSTKKMEALNAEVSRIQEVMAELTIKIQDGTSRLEGLKAEARVQPSPFTVPTDPQEEVRLLRARIAQMEGSMEGDVQEAKRVKICVVPRGRISSQGATKTSCVGCRTGRPTCKRQHWQGMVRRWHGCATSWAPQLRVGQQFH